MARKQSKYQKLFTELYRKELANVPTKTKTIKVKDAKAVKSAFKKAANRAKLETRASNYKTKKATKSLRRK